MTPPDDRQARLAEALRANLRKRKGRARAEQNAATASPAAVEPAGGDDQPVK